MSADRATIVAAARQWIGTPYRHRASLKHVGCDCLGLLRGVWRDVQGEEPEVPPPYAADWAQTRREEILLCALRRRFDAIPQEDFDAGDIVVFRFRDHLPAAHVGLATSSTHMIHAHSGACVAEVAIGANWRKRLAAAFAFPAANP